MSQKNLEVCRTYSDEQLLQLTIQKEPCALEVLYDRHAQLVYQRILHIVTDVATAEDLVQECFWTVWKKADQYCGSGTVKGWLLRMAHNKALDHLRRQKSRPQSTLSLSEQATEGNEALQWISPTLSIEYEFEQRETAYQIQAAMQCLPNEQRLCLELAYFQEMSQSEIADATHTPLGTIKTRIRIGMEKLSRILYGMAPAIAAHGRVV